MQLIKSSNYPDSLIQQNTSSMIRCLVFVTTCLCDVQVRDDLLIASDNGLVSLLLLLDFSAAFNTTDNNILLQSF